MYVFWNFITQDGSKSYNICSLTLFIITVYTILLFISFNYKHRLNPKTYKLENNTFELNNACCHFKDLAIEHRKAHYSTFSWIFNQVVKLVRGLNYNQGIGQKITQKN